MNTDHRPAEDVLAELAQLSSQSIATLFAETGIKGHRGDCSTCPVAVFIQRETGAESVLVTSLFAHVDEKKLHLPFSAQDFIINFDSGYYAELYGRSSGQ